MSEVATIGLDIAKNVFHAHGVDASGRALFSRKTVLSGYTANWQLLAVAPYYCMGDPAVNSLGGVSSASSTAEATTPAIPSDKIRYLP